jgi:cellulose synthase/poly-beta-1,6-N-acetylglucosamine synthase-like glycosyltransferase
MTSVRRWVRRHPVKSQRFLEILPGFISWSMILFPFWGSLVMPAMVSYYVLTFSVYWLYRSLTMAVLSLVAHYRIKASQRNNWLADAMTQPDFDKLNHVIVIPTYKEPITTLQRTLTGLSKQTVPLKTLHIILGFEEREGEDAVKKAKQLQAEFGKTFGNLWYTLHPDIEGEVKGKSSNVAWAAKEAKIHLIDEQKADIHFATITSEDADVIFDKQYFAALSYEFLSSPKRYNRIWQGSLQFYNNIWSVPTPIRVLSSIFSVTQMYILMRRDRLVNFSSYSIALELVHEIGYWDTDVIPEDYRMFFKVYFAKKGDLEVDPIFLPIFADAAEANGFWPSMINQYEQIKRWAWGVSDDAYIIRQYILAEGIPFWDKTLRVIKVVEDHFLWPVNWFAVTIAAFLPPLLNEDFARTALGKTLPQVTSGVLTLSLLSLVVIWFIDLQARPPHPNGGRSIFRRILEPFEFLLLPVIGFFFSALPGIDAHTRLMFGKYIEYRVTEKV